MFSSQNLMTCNVKTLDQNKIVVSSITKYPLVRAIMKELTEGTACSVGDPK